MKKNYLNYGITMLMMGIVWFFDILPHNNNKKLDFGGDIGGTILGAVSIVIGILLILAHYKNKRQ